MLQVTERVFQDNQLVGYNLTDGQLKQIVSKFQAWVLAKDKQIINVIATGDETNPGLTGINGFELKKLPKVNCDEPSQKSVYTNGDMVASRLRHELATGKQLGIGNRDYVKETEKRFLKEDVQSGVLSKENCRTLSNNLEVVNVLIDKENPGKLTPLVIGYMILNSSNQAIDITRMTATLDHSTTQVQLEPNQSICLNRAEVAILASKPEVGSTFSNGKLVGSFSHKQLHSMYEYLVSYYIMFSGTLESIKKNIQDVESEDNISKYFIPNNNGSYDNNKYTHGDAIASMLRHAIKNDSIPEYLGTEDYKNGMASALRNDAQSGILSMNNCRTLSNSIVIEKALINKNNKERLLGTLSATIIGYKIINIGSQAIDITRMTATSDHSTSHIQLESGQSVCLNRAEMAMLASKPEIGCTFKNGKLVSTTRTVRANNIYEFLRTFFVKNTEGSVQDIEGYLQDVESTDNINRYFIPNNTVNNLKQRGIMAGFKR